LAVSLLRERRFEEAIEPLLKAIARDDENRPPWILLGEAYLRVDRPYKAAVAYLRSLELSPKDEQAWLGLGRVLRFIDELPTAAAVLERATRIRPEHADTWVERGLVLASMQKLPEALRSFGKALDIRPDHRIALAKRTEIEARLREQGAVEADPEPAKSDTVPRPPNAAEAEAAFEVDILEEIEDSIQEEARKTMQAVREGPRTVPPAPVPEAARPPRVPTFVEGLDESLEGGIPWGHLVLIEGAPGTMKSSLAFSILLHNAAREGLHCLYVSLEERASSLLKQMGSVGLKLDVPKGSLVVLDPRTAADILSEKKDWVDALEAGIKSIKEKRGLDLIVIDSLEALEVLAKFKDRRREMYRLFEWLRDLAVTSFVVTERPDWLIAGHVLQGRWDEDFLGAILHGPVILIRGASGTMKSCLAYYVLYHNALEGTPGLYVTLEQPAGGLLEHVAALGLKATAVSDALPILDLSRGREHLEEMVTKVGAMTDDTAPRGEALIAVWKAKVLELRKKRKFQLLAIDSWDALELMLEFQDRRAETFGFFEWLRDLGVTSLLISEEPGYEAPATALEEEFLADGIVHLRLQPVSETSYQRRVQCVKMRRVKQDSDDHTLLFENGRFEVARAIG